MASREDDDCERYFRLRMDEISDEMTRSLASAATRNQSLALLLRTKVDRRTGRDDRERRMTLDTLAEMRDELAQNSEQVTVVRDRLRGQLGRLVDDLQPAGGGHGSHDADDDDKGDVVVEMTAANTRLAEVVRADRETLDHDVAEVRRSEDRLYRKQLEIDRLEMAVAASIEAAEKKARARAHDDGGRRSDHTGDDQSGRLSDHSGDDESGCPSNHTGGDRGYPSTNCADDESGRLSGRVDSESSCPSMPSPLTCEFYGWSYDDEDINQTLNDNTNV